MFLKGIGCRLKRTPRQMIRLSSLEELWPWWGTCVAVGVPSNGSLTEEDASQHTPSAELTASSAGGRGGGGWKDVWPPISPLVETHFPL